ncbi:MAG: hypothetical protein RLZ42_63, partial [Armatimonadota bacterium]
MGPGDPWAHVGCGAEWFSVQHQKIKTSPLTTKVKLVWDPGTPGAHVG